MPSYETLQRDQRNIERYLNKAIASPDLAKPADGWIRTIRKSLGMTAAQLGSRIASSRKQAQGESAGISANSVVNLERNEQSGSATLKSLEAAAEALGCTFVYALVPSPPLSATFEQQIQAKLKEIKGSTGATMALEDQLASDDDLPSDQIIEQLIKGGALWD